uniref:exo-alpha-sialidase n=1 Tax=Acanthochromis polyacanthus TaxID=80966 RepID=A0A3Q1G063_9TELE
MDSGYSQQTVFHRKFYRIPALFCERESKTLLAFAEQRTAEDDTMLLFRSNFKEAKIDGYRPMNPCPLYDINRKVLFLFFICVEGTVSEQQQKNCHTNKARLCYITSKDLGQTWTELTDLTDKLPETWDTFAVGPGHGLQIENGRLIVPLHAYTSVKKSCCVSDQMPSYRALSLYSDDSGKTWQFGKMFEAESNECQMAEFFDKSGKSIIYCNARTEGGFREEHVSEDNGHTFSKLSGAQKLVETGSGCEGSVVSFPAQNEDVTNDQSQKNKWLLFTHPSHQSNRVSLGVYLNKTLCEQKSWSKNSGLSGLTALDIPMLAAAPCSSHSAPNTVQSMSLMHCTFSPLLTSGRQDKKHKCH